MSTLRLQKLENGIPRQMDMAEDDENKFNLGVYYCAWQTTRVEKEKQLQAEAAFVAASGGSKPSKTRLI